MRSFFTYQIDMNVENLQKIADHIRTVPQEMFDMHHYRVKLAATRQIDYESSWAKPECDSIGCAIGHSTVLDIENVKKNFMHDIAGKPAISFAHWSEQFTGLSKSTPQWVWCFATNWGRVDNTPEGAARRIEWLVKNGLPKNWDEQMMSNEPLCYLKNLNKMEELLNKVSFLAGMMTKLADDRMEDAYDAFKKQHGYDLRDKGNVDHLEFIKWYIKDGIVTLKYHKVTCHDMPYGIELKYDISELFINCE